MISLSNPLIPRNPNGTPFVVVIGRISSPQQNIENIDASYEDAMKYVRGIYDGEMDIRYLGEQGSGMLVDRQTIRQAEELIASGRVDLVVAEDLSRIYRNPRMQYAFVQDCVDAGVRVICPGDNLDTADENWEVTLGATTLRHGLFIPDLRRRIRRTATHTFHNGGMVLQVRFGYRKLSEEEATSAQFGPKDLRIAKIPACTPVIREMRERAMRVPNFQAIADWLSEEGIEPGAYVQSGRWTGKLVADLLRDPILSGTRQFRQVLYTRVFGTGKHKREKNSEPETEHRPELAHMTRDEQEEMWTVIGGPPGWDGNASESTSPLAGKARSRSLWPGQSATCGICGGQMWQMGEFLKCENSLKRHGKECWNHVQVPVDLARARMVAWLLQMFERLPECRKTFLDAAWEAFQTQRRRTDHRAESKRKELASLQRQAANLGKAIADGGQLDTLVAQLSSTEQRIIEIADSLEQAGLSKDDAFASYELVAANADAALRAVVAESYEFADVMRRFFPEFVIQPVQALDTGLVRPRGKLCFQSAADDSNEHGCAWIVLNFFDRPKHIAIVQPCLGLKAANPRMSYRKIGEELNEGVMTVKRAFSYARLMEAEGTADPYRELHEKPEHASRWR